MLVKLIPVISTTLGGYMLGSLGKAESWVQAIGTAQVDVGLAMVVANMNFGNVEIVVVIYSITVLVVLIPLDMDLGRRATKKA